MILSYNISPAVNIFSTTDIICLILLIVSKLLANTNISFDILNLGCVSIIIHGFHKCKRFRYQSMYLEFV